MSAGVLEMDGSGRQLHEQVERGMSLCMERDYGAAIEFLEPAHRHNPNDARVRSYYGLCLGLAERCFEESVALCQSAAKQEFFNPHLYLNLALLYLGFGFKSEGIRYLRRGLMIDPANQEILAVLRELGDRRAPVLGFLPRRHPINKWLGSAKHVLTGGWRDRAVA